MSAHREGGAWKPRTNPYDFQGLGPAGLELLAETRRISGLPVVTEVLDPREQQALLDALDAIPWAPTCPHGRPVAVPIEIAEIERRFSRR